MVFGLSKIHVTFQEEMWAMRFLMTGLCALCVWTSFVLPVSAGWDNVFQPTLFGRRQTSTSSYYVAPAVVVAQALRRWLLHRASQELASRVLLARV